ncbi:DNL zinc finger-domain-containing protein [Fennellomyces sp. T-0311]|nr:DNL zinc finger-domain-containing protein [Fennellomyces sp. T-0311]
MIPRAALRSLRPFCLRQRSVAVQCARPAWNRLALNRPSMSIAAHRSFHTCQPFQKEEVVDPKHQLLIGFTCEVCKERSHHIMSKLAYTKGVVLIECPGCKNRHLIADNLGWFRDQQTTVEDLVKEKGEAVRKVIVDKDGNEHVSDIMEWLPDVSEEERVKKEAAKQEAEKLRQQQQQQEDQ